MLGELARVYVRDALKRWLPEVEVGDVGVECVGTRLIVRVSIGGQTVEVAYDR